MVLLTSMLIVSWLSSSYCKDEAAFMPSFETSLCPRSLAMRCDEGDEGTGQEPPTVHIAAHDVGCGHVTARVTVVFNFKTGQDFD